MKHTIIFSLLTLCTLATRGQEIILNDSEHIRKSNLPHVYIDTYNSSMPTSKTTELWASMYYVDENNTVTYYDSLEIRCRGNSTYSNAHGKYAYRIKFASKQKLLGKGYAKAKKWSLLANQFDKTLMRNALTFILGEKTGLKFNPAAKFVDLTINGSFRGNYQISDQIDVRPHRVNITEQDEILKDTSNITGGYLLEVDGFKDFTTSGYKWDNTMGQWVETTGDGFYTGNYNVPIRIHYPDEDEIQQVQYNYIKNHVQEFENRLYSSDFTSATSGYRPLVDSTSLANWYICTEISGNVDGFFSTYFYKDQDNQHLFWGPLWDYDIAYNNDNRTDRNGTNDTSRQLMAESAYGVSNGCRPWMEQMWKDPWFAHLVNRRYKELIDNDIQSYLYSKIDSLEELLNESQEYNYTVWGLQTRYCRERVLYSTYDANVQAIKTYLNTHLPFLSQTFEKYDVGEPDPEPQPEPVIPDFSPRSNLFYGFSNMGSKTLLDADVTTDKVQCWELTDGRENQQWSINKLSNGYFVIVNRLNGMALNDPTQGEVGETVNVGTQLDLATLDSTSTRQQWNLSKVNDNEFNLINIYSKHTANLSGGGTGNATPVLSYTTNDRNSVSNNRKWTIEVLDSISQIPSSLETLENFDYALAYNPYAHRLHFGCDNPSDLTFDVKVYASDGRCVTSFRAANGADLTPMPRGMYIITWTVGGQRRSVKLFRD
ncbi:MAG: CotH kinase family protein [Bacteroidaceae bacterium]|nr:CotH kinase family protein [Bacteroidaceae bacterium]